MSSLIETTATITPNILEAFASAVSALRYRATMIRKDPQYLQDNEMGAALRNDNELCCNNATTIYNWCEQQRIAMGIAQQDVNYGAYVS